MERNELPEEWKVTTIGDVVENTETRNPASIPDDEFIYVDIGSVDNASATICNPKRLTGREAPSRARKVIRADDVLFATTRPYLKGIALVPRDLDNQICSTGFAVLRVRRDQLEPRWLFYLCRSEIVMGQVLVNMRGGTYPAVSDKDVRAAEILLPPLSEQHRIVACIEEFAQRAEEMQSLRREAIGWVENLMPTSRGQIFDELARNGCQAQRLEQVTAFLGRGRSTAQGTSEMRLIKTRHVYPDGLRPFDDCRLSDKEAAKCSPERILRPGDVLVCSSAAGCLGRPGFFPGCDFPCTTDTHVAIVRADPRRLDSRYLFHYFQSPQGQVELLSREQGGKWQEEKVGFRLTELNLADLRTVPVPLPPLEEQRRIVVYLDGLQAKTEAIRAAQAETQKELDALMPSILSKAFAGEL
ncbi:MAG: restriction endonuclease subunit S [Thermoflexales bacterium]|nr:restriction endonuclease subunit S [Thermoflexales bacterium]